MMVNAFSQTDAAQIDPPKSIVTQAARPVTQNGHPEILVPLRHSDVPAESLATALLTGGT